MTKQRLQELRNNIDTYVRGVIFQEDLRECIDMAERAQTALSLLKNADSLPHVTIRRVADVLEGR